MAGLNRLRLTRRQVLRLGLLGFVGVEVWYFRNWFGPFSPLDFMRWRLRALQLYVLAPPATVAVTRCAGYDQDVAGALRQAWDLSGEPAANVRGRTVVLKPNLVQALPDHPATTHAAVVDAAIGVFKDLGARDVVVADGSAFESDEVALVAAANLDPVLRRHGARFVDLNHDDLVEVPLRGGYSPLPSLWISRTVAEAEYLVSMPKLKCHHWTVVSLSLKNLFGIVPGTRYGWPKNILHWNDISYSVLALYETFRPHFAIVDGIVGMEGDGPIMGTPRPSGVLIAGSDGVAVDATAARIMGVDLASVDHLRLAGAWGLGQFNAERIVVKGSPVAEVLQRFQLPPSAAGGA